MKGEGWREPTLRMKTPQRTEGPQGTDKTRNLFRGMSETEGGQKNEVGRRRHHDITTSRQTDAVADLQITLQTSKCRGEELVQAMSLYSKKDLDCKVQMSQFEPLCQQTATNERSIEPL